MRSNSNVNETLSLFLAKVHFVLRFTKRLIFSKSIYQQSIPSPMSQKPFSSFVHRSQTSIHSASLSDDGGSAAAQLSIVSWRINK